MRAASTSLAAISCATAAPLVASFLPTPSKHVSRHRFAFYAFQNAAAALDEDLSGATAVASETMQLSRRSALQTVGGMAAILPFLSVPTAASAEDSSADLTSQLFNPDGSLKDSSAIEVEAKSRTVSTTFPSGDGDTTPGKQALVSIDGSRPDTEVGDVKVSYDLPEKWGDPSTGYLDKSEGVNAKSADAITVFQLAGPAEVNTLDKASTVGVAKALGIETLPSYNPSIIKADLISGRRSTRDGIVYYEFDLAVAPAKCASGSKEDLGLGFCPYDSIVLLGATVVDGRMYGIMVECDRDEWKKGNADLKRVRSSLKVESKLDMLEKQIQY